MLCTIVVLGGVLFWYSTSKSNSDRTETQATSDTRTTIQGTLQSVDCTAAGVGCTDWVLKLDNGDTLGLVVNQDIKMYADKKVRLAGKYVKTLGDGGPTFFEIQSIQALE
jgi:hypothetical protein